jgi:hypothetical protein
MKPRAPWWMMQPKEGESFVDFWLRAGMTMSKIMQATETELRGAEDVANDRLAHTYALRNRGLYLSKRNAWLKSFGYSA